MSPRYAADSPAHNPRPPLSPRPRPPTHPAPAPNPARWPRNQDVLRWPAWSSCQFVQFVSAIGATTAPFFGAKPTASRHHCHAPPTAANRCPPLPFFPKKSFDEFPAVCAGSPHQHSAGTPTQFQPAPLFQRPPAPFGRRPAGHVPLRSGEDKVSQHDSFGLSGVAGSPTRPALPASRPLAVLASHAALQLAPGPAPTNAHDETRLRLDSTCAQTKSGGGFPRRRCRSARAHSVQGER